MRKVILLICALVCAATTLHGQITGSDPQLRFRDTDYGSDLTHGLWRIRFNGDTFTVEKSTAAGGDFSTTIVPMSISATGINLNSPTSQPSFVQLLTTNANPGALTIAGGQGAGATENSLYVASNIYPGSVTGGPGGDNLYQVGSLTSRFTAGYFSTSLSVGSLGLRGGDFYAQDNTQAALVLDTNSSNTSSSEIFFKKSRGSATSRTIPQNGDAVLTLRSQVWSATFNNYEAASTLSSTIDGTYTDVNVAPTRWGIFTTNSSASVETQRWDSNQNSVFNLTGSNLAQNATGNFIYIPGVATGKPNGTPAASYTGAYPMVYDAVDNEICIWNGSAWKCTAALTN